MSTQQPAVITMTNAQRSYLSWVVDVLVYIVVLNLFVEYVDDIVIDSFTISILTALLLKALLDVLIGVEHSVAAFFERRGAKVLGVIATLAILFFSKLVILEAVNLVFGDHVELHGFFQIVALIVSMIVARKAMDAIYWKLGDPASGTDPGVEP